MLIALLEEVCRLKKIKSSTLIILILSVLLVGCSKETKKEVVSTTTEAVVTTPTEDSVTLTTTVEAEPETTKATPDWADKAVIYEVNVRQYTAEGTFNAFSEHLERLKELGVNTLWFMPIYPISETNRKGTLGSYYAISDYTAINPEFGTLEDFKALVAKAHEMGFKVVLDWVANHTGWDSTWILEHPDWYLQNESGEIVCPPGTDWDDVAQLNFESTDLRQEMIKSMKYWVEEIDVDGFRCDYAIGVPLDFWEAAREELTSVKEVYMLAEDDQSKSFLLKAFDSNYNWKFFQNVTSVAKGTKKASTIEDYINRNNVLPEGSFPINFIDNHDENSWNGTIQSRLGDEPVNAITALIFTMPGAPLIYSGQEAGLNKSLQFFEKDEIEWSNFPYSDIISKLCDIKINNPALYNGIGGKLQFVEQDNVNVIAFERTKDDNKITVIINMSKDNQVFTLDTSNLLDSDILLHGIGADKTNDTIEKASSETLNTLKSLSPWEFYIFSTKLN
ncbi:MAG: 1,4-alpha-glucan branching enzyme [Clostridiales bacterium]|jgi:glycosidase|nr:1,4-alpha-glucan branching enzyme [Clostridiales bacterium]